MPSYSYPAPRKLSACQHLPWLCTELHYRSDRALTPGPGSCHPTSTQVRGPPKPFTAPSPQKACCPHQHAAPAVGTARILSLCSSLSSCSVKVTDHLCCSSTTGLGSGKQQLSPAGKENRFCVSIHGEVPAAARQVGVWLAFTC